MSLAFVQAAFSVCDGRTRAAQIRQSAPLKIARTFDLGNGAQGVCLMDASPGMLAGDCYRFDFDLAARASVEVTTQGFTRVHPSRENGCELQTHLRVAADAHLEWFPEPLMLYADADLHAQTTVDLALTATFMASDIWCAGRVGRGENWEFARYRSRWNIVRAGAPVFASSLDLAPQTFAPQQLGAWREYTHSGNFWAFGPTLGENFIEAIWEIIENQNAVYAGASLLDDKGEGKGLVVSMLGTRAHDLQELTQKLRAQVRHARGILR